VKPKFRLMKNLFLFALLLSATFSFAQLPDNHTNDASYAVHYCDVHNAYERLVHDNPGIESEILENEERLERETEEFAVAGLADARNNYIIPVVFHIVHANGLENISDEQIYDAIRILNEDFNLGNVDVSAVIPEFQNIVANVGVEFRLARLDPNGACTKGIVRVFSTQTFSGGENLKSISPTWPRARYMNVWVAADLSGGAAGYTYNPGSVSGIWGAQADGIVIKHTYVGSIGTGNYMRSRALTHEVGHWINLRHPWGGTNEPGLESNCNSDDNVDDTPNTIGWTVCSLSGQSCGSLDNVQNFMEYSYCSRMFTQGQKVRMLAALNSGTASRNQLWSAATHNATGVLGEGTLCQVEIGASITEICVGDSVVFTDNSFHDITGRQWTFEGGFPASSSQQEVVVFYNEPGLYYVGLQVNSPSQTLSQTIPQYIRVWAHEGVSLPYIEDFESADNLLTHWSLSNPDNGVAWEVTNEVGFSGWYSLKLGNRYNPAGQIDEVMSKTINLSDTSTAVAMSFKYAYAKRNPGNSERLSVWISNDCGVTWSLRAMLNNNFDTGPYTSANWIPSGESQWQEVLINNITQSHYVSNFRFKFRFESDGGNNIFIDDINIGNALSLSTQNLIDAEEITLFPNPATNQVSLLINASLPFDYDLTIYNAMGQAVQASANRNFPGGTDQILLNTTEFSAGVYLVNLQAKGGNRIVKRLIISR
jgi:PKD repeat protein